MRLRMSVPPARMLASSQVEPSAAKASFSVAGLAYSKLCMLCVPLAAEGVENTIRGDRNHGNTDAKRVEDGVGDGRGATDGAGFAESDDAALIVYFLDVHVNDDLTD